MPQCCQDDDRVIFSDDYDSGAPLSANYIDASDQPGTTDCVIQAGVGINSTSALHSDYTSSAGRFAEAYVVFPDHVDHCGNPRKEFAVGGYWNFKNTYSNDAAPLIEIRDTRLAEETLLSLQTDGRDIVVYAGQNPTSDLVTQEDYRAYNIVTYGTTTFRKIEIRGSIAETQQNDCWFEVRIDGRVYQNGEDGDLVSPSDPPSDCPKGNTGFGNFEDSFDPTVVSAWDKVGVYPQGDFDCLYIKDVAAYCNDNPVLNRPGAKCPPAGPGTIHPGGATPTYVGPSTGGIPPSQASPVDAQSLDTTDPVYISLDLTLVDGSVKSYGQQGVAVSGRNAVQARVLRFGPVEYALSDRFGSIRAQIWDVTLADDDGAIRGFLSDSTNRYFKKWQGQLFGESETARLAGTARRSLARGRCSNARIEQDETVTLTFADELSRADSPFSLEQSLPRYVISEVFKGPSTTATGIQFLAQTTPDNPDLPAFDNPPEAVRDQPLPYLFGPCSDEWRLTNNPPATPFGICNAYLLGDVLLKSGSERWQMYLCSQYAIKAFKALFGSNLATDCPGSVRLDLAALTNQILLPGQGNWSSYFSTNYIDVTYGSLTVRTTCFFARGPISQQHVEGKVPFSFNCDGIETVGDSSGTTIDYLAYIWQQLLDQVIFGKVDTGNWLGLSTFSDGVAKVNTASVATVNAIHEQWLNGAPMYSYFIMDKKRAAKDWLAELLVSGVMRQYTDHHGRPALSAIDDQADLSALTSFTDQRHVRDGSFKITSELGSELETSGTYDAGYEPATGKMSIPATIYTAQNATSWGDPYRAADRHFLALFDSNRAANAISRLVAETQDGITRGQYDIDLAGTDLVPGQLHRLTDFRGLGSSGWTDRVLKAESLVLNPNVSEPAQPDDLTVTVIWVDRHRQLVAPAGLVGGGTTTDGSTQSLVGFSPVGNTDGSPSDGWIVGNVADGTARRVG